uniref:Ig-like domain-containing protein n=1 Tax=Acanthochromis polyacanthus TaxID=80966 RepID=A0A3Q1GHZ7_9TELE
DVCHAQTQWSIKRDVFQYSLIITLSSSPEEKLKFLDPIEDIETQEKKTIGFVCKVNRPEPEVKWAKDEADIDKERMIVETEGKNSTLFIKKAVRADHGKYQITGTNSSGTKTAETRVDIMGQ